MDSAKAITISVTAREGTGHLWITMAEEEMAEDMSGSKRASAAKKVLAAEIVESLETALEQFKAIYEELGEKRAEI